MDSWSVKICKALGHPVRYTIVQYLTDGPRCVCELNDDVGFSQSNLSQHLRILKEAGLVRSEKDGLKIFYQLTCPEISALLGSIERVTACCLKELQTND